MESRSQLGDALLAAGQPAEAEGMLHRSIELALPSSGRQSRTVNSLVGRLPITAVAQGRHTQALALLDEQAARIPSADGAADRLIQARLRVDWMAGVEAAVAQLPAVDAVLSRPQAGNLNSPLQFDKARTLLLLGRAAEARAFIGQVRIHWEGADMPVPGWTTVLALITRCELATGDATAPASTAQGLVTLFDGLHATSGGGWRDANELLALARARQGDRADAARALVAAAAVPGNFPSLVAKADSSLDRAEILRALGRHAEARPWRRPRSSTCGTNHRRALAWPARAALRRRPSSRYESPPWSGVFSKLNFGCRQELPLADGWFQVGYCA